VLRTTFRQMDGRAVQVVSPVPSIGLDPIDLTQLPEDERAAEAHRLATEHAAVPFDLAAGPLFRVRLVKVADNQHVLLMNMHHAVSDGWSMGVLRRDLGALLAAETAGVEPELPPLPVTYADHARWQREWLTGAALERQVGYWKRKLTGAPAVLELPTDKPRPEVQTHAGDVAGALLPRDLADALNDLARREGSTLFMVLLAAFKVLLARYAGQADVVVGTPIAGRTQAETEGLIGLFLNTLALRTDLSGDPTAREVLARVRETTLGAYAHQEVPFEKLLEEVQPERSLSYTPLFQVQFNLLNFADGPAEGGGVGMHDFGSHAAPEAKFDLNLYAQESAEGVELTLIYNTDLFERERMLEALGHLGTLLAGMAADPERRVSELDLLTEDERRARAALHNTVTVDAPFTAWTPDDIDQTIHGRFARVAAENADRVAIRTRRHTWTYAELDAAADAVARAILATASPAAERVALLFEHDAPMIAGILGALRAGKTYVPLDPTYPRERVAYILADSQAGALVTNARNLVLAHELAAGDVPVLDVDGFANQLAQPTQFFPLPLAGDGPGEGAPLQHATISPDAPAYILYTSGSTGEPKGVVQAHRNVLHFIRAYTNNLHISADDRLTLFSSYTFDAAVMGIYGALLNGATLCPFDWKEEAAAGLAEWMRAEGITIYHSTPTVYRHLIGSLAGGEVLDSVRLVVMGGEEVQRRDVELWRRHFGPRCVFINGLGPTESTVTLQNFIGRDTAVERTSVSVGFPVAETEVVLATPLGEQIAVYGAGEITIRSPHVALGYWRKAEATDAAFGVSGDGRTRIYRTGDLGRRLPDGGIEYLGRKDFQLKIRGHRVEAGEVETALRAHPAVRDAVVAGRDDRTGGKRLVAWLVPEDGAEIDAAEMRDFARGRLPEYMVPSAFTTVDAFPLTPNGKVDRRALPEPEEAAGSPTGEHVAPRTPTEEVLAGIWSAVLGIEELSVDADFFALGGHSLLATQVVSRIREAFRVELPLRALFEAPTVAALAARVDAAVAQSDGGTELPPLVPQDRGELVPLSFAQERLWFVEQLLPGTSTYVMPAALRLAGPVDVAATEKAIGEILRRHEVLRARFVRTPEGVMQTFDAWRPFHLAVTDLSALDPDAREAEAMRLASEHAQTPLDLEQGPLFRSELLRLGENEHVLLIAAHHAVSDGWSSGILFRELFALQQAFAAGQESPLAPLPVQYADYALWQRSWLHGDELERQLGYWREHLRGAPGVLELPTDRPRPPVQTFRGSNLWFSLPDELVRRAHDLSRREGATLFMTLLAAWQVLLARYSGQEDVVVGTTIANRTRREVEGLVGFFANTLALRGDLGGDPAFRDVVRRARESTLGAYAHQDLPFEKLVDELDVGRSLSHSPVFQVMFVLQNAPTGPAASPSSDAASADEGGTVQAGMQAAEYGKAKFDVTLTLTETGGGLVGSLEYNTDLFDEATMARLAGHFAAVLDAGTMDAAQPISRLRLLDDAERALVLDEWNATERGYPTDLRIHDLFQEQAMRTPDRVALVHDAEALTYAELNARANQLARHLRSLDVGPETLVAVCMERTPEMIVALLAVLKAGGAYVPVDQNYPAERIAYMLNDTQAPVVLTQARVATNLPATQATVVSVDADWDEIAKHVVENLSVHVRPENAAYAIYTSGSTGRPKGVHIEHRSTVALLHWLREAVTDEERSSVLGSTSISFDVSIAEIFGTLCWGGKLVLVENALSLAELPGGTDIRLASMVPSAAAELLRMGGIPSTVRSLNLGGEPLPNALAQGLYALDHIDKVLNLYGPTEDTTYSTFSVVERGGPKVYVGRPVANTKSYVLDRNHQPVPVGVPGELYLAGSGLSRGYLNRPALTAERYVPNPFSSQPGARMYRVGDLVRYLPDGTIEYLGRLDHQVKIRGFRIETGEIEAVLAAHPSIESAAVIAREDVPGDRRLAAYLVAEAGREVPPVADLRAYLKAHVPEYMVPSAFVTLDALPLSPNGKVDRRALPVPEAASGAEYVAPSTATERELAALWADLLHAGRVGAHDNFFELGGHSLVATQLVNRLRDALGVELPLRTVFEAPTVAEMAARIDTAKADAVAVPQHPKLSRIARDARRAHLEGGEQVHAAETPSESASAESASTEVPSAESAAPLSFAQERLWFTDQVAASGSAYTIPLVLTLGGAQPEVMEAAIREIVRRHEPLRTTFREVDGRPVQVIGSAEDFELPFIDLRAVPEDERPSALSAAVAEQTGPPFDLARGPLFRGALIQTSDADQVLALAMHHIVSDGWSVGVIQREINVLYTAFAAGAPSPLPPVPLRYAEHAVRQREWLTGDELDRQLAYWKQALAGAPEVLALPTDRQRPAVQTFAGGTATVVLPRDLSDGLGAVAREEGATLFMTLLAAYAVLLGRYSGQDDVVVGSPTAGRNRSDLEGLVGFFVNNLVLRADLSGDPSFRELVRRAKETTLGAFAHQDLPFEKLVDELKVERSLSHTPVFQVLFNLLGAQTGAVGAGTAEGEMTAQEGGAAKYDLSLAVQETAQGITASLNYNVDLFDAATVRRMLAHFHTLLAGATADPDAPISRLRLTDADERGRVLAMGTDARRDFPFAAIHRLFEAQAANTPDAVALVHAAEALSYSELNARANQLAHHLRSLGVGPESLVGVCMERRPEMIIALFAVLKAGGAYVPLDPAYPADRIAYMLEDSRAAVVLTQSSVAAHLPSTEAVVVSVDADWEKFSHLPTDNRPVDVRPENAAYAIYTSGSTGKPKGVQIEHRSTSVLLHWLREAVTDSERSAALGSTSISFDVSIAEIFGTLCWGGKLILVENALSLAELSVDAGVRLATMVPSAAAELLRMGAIPSTVRTFNLGGEALPNGLAQGLYALGHVDKVLNLYGPTEDTTYSTWSRVEDGGAKVYIGRPVANTQAYVADASLQPVPIGVPGELYLAGDGLARGYLNRPALTAERFIPDPFAAEPGARMYRVGDLVRWTDAGVLDYLGRLDHQVKIRGFRIETGEIESALTRHPAVQAAAVIDREDAPGDRRLVAYVVTAADVEVTIAELRAHLKASLPDYMVPSAFVGLDALPLTPNGKLDRRALPAPQHDAEAEFVAPRTDTEVQLAALWAELLHVERVGVNDSFFELGGHSLIATQLTTRVRNRMGVELSLRTVFEAPTLGEMAAHIDAHRPASDEPAPAARTSRITRQDRRGTRPGGG
ncbi:MAG TPA: amino acid adenylation domain-containing protein, partial [Longimicrobiaceae bacterium]|nr:amino acid adenylation domain-containing protein [Longimicrobiaceae bacterium]